MHFVMYSISEILLTFLYSIHLLIQKLTYPAAHNTVTTEDLRDKTSILFILFYTSQLVIIHLKVH